MNVWLCMTREKGAANPTPTVLSSKDLAHKELEQFADRHKLRTDLVDQEHEPDGRLVWFESLMGDGPEAWIEGPLEVR